MKILVLAGGTSPERDVSLESADAIAKGLAEAGHEVIKMDTSSPDNFLTADQPFVQGPIDREPPDMNTLPASDAAYITRMLAAIVRADVEMVYLALHGGWGEDGGIQHLLDMAGIRYTGCGPLASAMAMDKTLTKEIAEQLQIPTPDWVFVPAGESFFFESMVFPLIVKPNRMGSTFGLHKVGDQEQLEQAVKQVREQIGGDVLIEGYIPGRELTCGMLDAEALPLVEIIPESGMYDYASKYTHGLTRYEVPATVPEETVRDIQEYSRRICRRLRVEVAARVDFRLDEEGRPWLLEVNTLPGMTSLSLLPMAAAEREINFSQLLDRIVKLSTHRYHQMR